MNCGLLGEKLTHSFSPYIHSMLGTYDYRLYEVSPDSLCAFFQKTDFQGLNVTIPYKKSVIPYCKHLSPEAKKVGAVNTILKKADGSMIGHNTDYFGFRYMANRSGLNFYKKKVLVLGSGGAANTVCAVLDELGSDTVVVSRTGENNYDNLYLHKDAKIIVNTTPVGMYPNTLHRPLSLSGFPDLEGVLDLIYNPSNTMLLQQAESRGLVALNGLWMLAAQAKESAEWFTNSAISDDVISDIHRKIQAKTENIVLIGMPGSGKSTVGKALARLLCKDFADTDELIVQKEGRSIPDIFSQKGEAYFRDAEARVIQEISKAASTVIATGGGCVTVEENLPVLKQNGTVIWLKRDILDLATDGRPISQSVDLNDLYAKRAPIYQRFCDFSVLNDASAEEVAIRIQKLLLQEVKDENPDH